MDRDPHPQAIRLDALLRAASAGREEAARGLLFASRRGLALVNAAFDLFECDGLYDMVVDVRGELGLEAELDAEPVMPVHRE